MGAKGPGKTSIDGEEEMNYRRLRRFKKQVTQIIIWVTGVRQLILSLGLVTCSLWLIGCGYTTRTMISDKYRSIYITPFVNKIDITKDSDVGSKYKIYRPRLETDITSAITNRFLFDGNLKPVKKEKADLILKGEVLEYRKDPLRYDENDEVTEYRMNLVVSISLWDCKENKLLWEAGSFTGYTDYYTSFYPLSNVTKLSDDEAIDSALTDLARRVVERTINEW